MTVMACLGPASTNSVAHDLTRVAAPACARHLKPRSCSPATASCALRVRPPSQRGFTYPRLQATRQRRIEAVSLKKNIEFEKNDEPSGCLSPRSPLPELESGVLDAYGEDVRIPTQAETIARGDVGGTTLVQEAVRSPDVDYLQELLAIQAQGPRAIGFFGTRNMGFMHQQLIEILSYAMVITNNHIYTSGASGTNAAVIRGALRAEKPDLLTVILPQSLVMQSPESQELLAKVGNVIDMPHNDNLPLIEASRLCNMDIVSHVQQVICFAFHDSKLLMETCREAKALRKIVTLFYLD